jgi:hypothetical protein
MSMKSLEAVILVGARVVFKNAKLRQKDIQEWSSGAIAPHEGEVVEHIPDPGVFVAIKAECDKRKK